MKNLQLEYNGKKSRMDQRIHQEAAKNTTGSVKLSIFRSEMPSSYEQKQASVERNQGIDSDLDLVPGHEKSPPPNESQQPSLNIDEKLSHFVRSKGAIKMRIENKFNHDLGDLDQEKTELIQELCKKLVELDTANNDKRILNQQLLDQIKFVRDL